MKIKVGITVLIVIIISCVFIYTFRINYDSRGFINNVINNIEGKTLNKKFNVKIKSGNLSTDYNVAQAISDIDRLKLNTVNIPVAINIDTLSSSNMSIDEQSKKKAIELIKKLRWKKINIILEPYPWIADGSKVETEWKPDNINDFFWNWKTKVLKPLIDDVAVPYHVDALTVGSSFTHMEYAYGYWSDTVDYARKYYKGLINYRTSWWVTAEWKPELKLEYDKKLNNRLFSKVDFISIAAYFELTENDTNTVDTLVSAIHSTQIYDRKQDVKQQIKNFYDKWNKPIFFGELGFPDTDKASVCPWNPNESDKINGAEQANCFEAYREVFQNEYWNLGFSIFAIGDKSVDKRYYPSAESIAVIKSWYSNADKNK